MNPIEEMMEKYRVRKKTMCEWTCKDSEFCNASCVHYETKQNVYPPFTLKKQLSLFLLVCKLTRIEVSYKPSQTGQMFCKLDVVDKPHKSFIGLSFGKAVATLLRSCYDDLIPAQKQQIKEILEG